MPNEPEVANHYSAHYGQFGDDVHARVRRDAYDQDIGQNSWLTVDELAGFASSLDLDASAELLDVGCGSGGPVLWLVAHTGCNATGVELYEEAVEAADRQAAESGLAASARFVQADASQTLPFDDGSFDAILCVDVINHLPKRRDLFLDWRRVLRPRGRLLFTDPLVVTGPLGSDEIAVRTSIGYGLFMPEGENERLLGEAGMTVIKVEDTTDSTARVAQSRHDARVRHEEGLRQVEGDETYEGRQRFFQTAAILARERRLSRIAIVAEPSN